MPPKGSPPASGGDLEEGRVGVGVINPSPGDNDTTTISSEDIHNFHYVNWSWVITVLIVVLGCAASGAFLAMGVSSSQAATAREFERSASDAMNALQTAWHDYETAGLWVHSYCRFNNFTTEQYRDLYHYISHSLEFLSVWWIRNVTDIERNETDAQARRYYQENYLDTVNYRGFLGFEPDGDGGFTLLPRSRQVCSYRNWWTCLLFRVVLTIYFQFVLVNCSEILLSTSHSGTTSRERGGHRL